MKLYIDRAICDHTLPVCERCLGRLLRYPLGEDRPCITAIEDDDDPDLKLVLKTDGQEFTLVLDDEAREMAALEGFSSFLSLEPAFYRTK